MALSEPLAVLFAAAITGVLTGGPALWIARRRPSLRAPRRASDAWQKQAKELDALLRAQYERDIAYREALYENAKRELAAEQRRNRRGTDD